MAMCIVAFAWQLLPDMPLLLLSNRDEWYVRPAEPVHHWENSPIYAGLDVQQGGTWLGVTAQGRWAILTNIREGEAPADYPTSRGHIVRQFLQSEQIPIRFAQQLEQQQQHYAGFNLFIGNRNQAVYLSNRGEAAQILSPGVYVCSNTVMSRHWQKTAHLRQRFVQEFLPLIQHNQQALDRYLPLAWEILQDERQVEDELLPQTGVPYAMEKLLSSTFIRSPHYGTRCSNVLAIYQQHIDWTEKIQQGQQAGQCRTLHITS